MTQLFIKQNKLVLTLLLSFYHRLFVEHWLQELVDWYMLRPSLIFLIRFVTVMNLLVVKFRFGDICSTHKLMIFLFKSEYGQYSTWFITDGWVTYRDPKFCSYPDDRTGEIEIFSCRDKPVTGQTNQRQDLQKSEDLSFTIQFLYLYWLRNYS